jgi:mono/diheme cytochrome c family protein
MTPRPARFLTAMIVAVSGAAAGAEFPDAERGRRLYENHCIVCHTAKVHRREPPLPLNVEELRGIVTLWARNESLSWGREEIEDVVVYLNRTHYRYNK